MKPAVLIATHDRLYITSKTIECLLKQSVIPNIVLVVSNTDELFYFKTKFPTVHVIQYNNYPLGQKWQFGVDYIKKALNASSLTIQGSDDILSVDYFKNIEPECDFTGLQYWYIYDPLRTIVYEFEYVPYPFPLGGGRTYSKALLNTIDWQIFDTNRNSCLDDKGWNFAQVHGRKTELRYKNDKQNILAVKGQWDVMNPLEVTLKHKNAKLIATHEDINAKRLLKKMFDYE